MGMGTRDCFASSQPDRFESDTLHQEPTLGPKRLG